MHRTIKTVAVLGLALVLSATAFSQDKIVLTLEESLRLALLQNPMYLAEKAKEDQASAVVRQASPTSSEPNAQGTDILDKKVFDVLIPSLFPGMTAQRFKFDFTRTYQLTLNFSVPLYAGGRLSPAINRPATTFRRRRRHPPRPPGDGLQRQEGLLRLSPRPPIRGCGPGGRGPGRETPEKRPEPLRRRHGLQVRPPPHRGPARQPPAAAHQGQQRPHHGRARA